MGSVNNWITFTNRRKSKSGKTSIWDVNYRAGFIKNADNLLGAVQWVARWRAYGFWPIVNTVYEKESLRILADFCESKTTLHHKNRKKDSK